MLETPDSVWESLRLEASNLCDQEPQMEEFLEQHVLNHCSLSEALVFCLASQIQHSSISLDVITQVFLEVLQSEPQILFDSCLDLKAYVERDAACDKLLMPLVYFKGFKALQVQRISHRLWNQGRHFLALFLQSQVAAKFAVDIHPGASLGSGIMLDHATGLVIGETTVIGDDVSILHSVTLGGVGSESGDRHPKIGSGVLISAGAKVLGNVCIGKGAKIGAGSLVIDSVKPYSTVVGVPAKVVGENKNEMPALEMNQHFQIISPC
jgi:serine O-acetyltransferase